MKISRIHDSAERLARDARLEAYRIKADPAIALVSAFYFVLLLTPRVAITSLESSRAITFLDVAFWIIVTADTVYRFVLATDRRSRLWLLVALGLLLLGPLAFFSISQSTRDIVRIALISVVGLRAIDSVRYFFRLRSILYIVGAVILTVVAFGMMMTATEKGHANANVESLSDGLWWSVSTVSTVGYGDKFPVTNSGRMIAAGLMAFGVAMFGILTATLANAFASRTQEDDAGQYASLHEQLERIEQNQSQVRFARRTRAPHRPARRTPAPHIGAPPTDEGATTG